MSFYPCLYDYIKDDFATIAATQAIFDKIKELSSHIFADYDNELLSELAFSYYYERAHRPLKVLYYQYAQNVVDWEDTDSITNFFEHLGKVAYSRFGDNWEKIYNVYFIEQYKPLENYSMLQERTPDLAYGTTTNRKQDTKVDTSGKTKVVPFNSSSSVLTGESEGDSETTEEKTKNEIESSSTETGKETLTRAGNIGVTTSQQMLQSELDLRKLDFVKRIFADIDRVLLRDYVPYDDYFPL